MFHVFLCWGIAGSLIRSFPRADKSLVSLSPGVTAQRAEPETSLLSQASSADEPVPEAWNEMVYVVFLALNNFYLKYEKAFASTLLPLFETLCEDQFTATGGVLATASGKANESKLVKWSMEETLKVDM